MRPSLDAATEAAVPSPTLVSVAEAFLSYKGRAMDWVRLHHLVYLAKSHTLSSTGTSLIPDLVEVWDEGPVFPGLLALHEGTRRIRPGQLRAAYNAGTTIRQVRRRRAATTLALAAGVMLVAWRIGRGGDGDA